uniref:Uncharacterized protein n=1 Tax=Vitis vinifera TaxID=29760 RepID=A5BKW7_VITVI|nr:hypothetical protein VITISV_038197 [Vitis vinifera]
MALVCQKVASQLRNPLRNGAFPAKMGSFMLWWFVVVSQLRNDAISQLRNGAPVLRNGTRVPKVASQLRNSLRNGALAAKLGIFTLWSFAAVS